MNNVEKKVIDFAQFSDKIFLGYEKGKAFRKAFNLDQIDHNNEKIDFVFSDDIYAISNSFIRGMLEESILALASEENFYNKYSFTTRHEIRMVVHSMVIRTLMIKKHSQ